MEQGKIPTSAFTEITKRERVVFDTCVLLRAMEQVMVCGQRHDKRCRASFEALKLATGRHALCFTPDTRKEALRMLAKHRPEKHSVSAGFDRLGFVRQYIAPAVLMVQPQETSLVCRDRDDQMFLSAANGGGAKYLVTTDRALLELGFDGLCQIVAPGRYWAIARGDPFCPG